MPEPITLTGLYVAHKAFHQHHPRICSVMHSAGKSALKATVKQGAKYFHAQQSRAAEQTARHQQWRTAVYRGATPPGRQTPYSPEFYRWYNSNFD